MPGDDDLGLHVPGEQGGLRKSDHVAAAQRVRPEVLLAEGLAVYSLKLASDQRGLMGTAHPFMTLPQPTSSASRVGILARGGALGTVPGGPQSPVQAESSRGGLVGRGR